MPLPALPPPSLYLLWLAPTALLAAAWVALQSPGLRPRRALAACAWASGIVLAIAAAAIGLLAAGGPATIGLLPGLSLRLDAVSATMLALVSVTGWAVLRFAATYLDGEARQGWFMARLSATLAAVLLLVLAGNLVQLLAAWIATSLLLQGLLLFYPQRPAAQRAAHKKFLTARLADLALGGAVLLLWHGHGSADIATILAGPGAAGDTPAAWLLGVAALLKSAQFPTHGWLTEVMEAPTPVSALLHAGLINAGGFLLVRFAPVMLHAPSALAAIAMIGGFTALFASLVMLTQPAVKTALAWSTVAQMGFMILECGLALFPLALLHIVAHSLYKAQAFLASGGAVEKVAAGARPGPVAVPGARAIGRAFAVALAIYAVAATLFRFAHESPQALALGMILIFGSAYLLAQGFADAAPGALTRRTAASALVTALGYFALQYAFVRLTAGVLPPSPRPGALQWAVLLLTVTSFGATALLQASFPLWSSHPAAAGLRVHLANGLYVNALLDRLLTRTSRPATSQGQPA